MDASEVESRGVAVEEVRAEFEARIPLGRYGTPGEFARVAAFLALPANTEYRSTKRSELKFHALLADDSQEVRFGAR